ncbi:MAG: LysR family transcriptional regulator [Chloroflexi bacterium]|nr:LysR family transcriptional regulator [Chloroflexota bacterium]MBV9600819.1 LysR family transcriptional regulator [Chloroflexota bacterium]
MFATTELQVLVGLQSGKTLAEIGEDLLLSHPSVSKTLRAAEQKAGLKLTEHHGRRLRLTLDGARVAAAAHETLLKLRELDTMLSSIKTGEGGALRILASNGISSYVLPPVISQLLQAVHEVDLRIHGADGNTDIWEMFDTGGFEVAIARSLPPPHIPATHLFDDELCLCVAADSELARRKDVDIRWPDLSSYTLIGPIGNEDMWRQFSLLGIRPRRRIQVSNAVLAKRFVENGEALALMYRTVALEESAQGRIAILRLPEAPTTVSYWLATRTPDGTSPLLEKFLRLLHTHVRSFRHALRRVA